VRIVLAIVTAGAVAALVVSATLAITGSDSSNQPRRGKLAQIRDQPLTLRGSGFVPGEKVRVSAATSGAKETRTLTADKSGSFTVSFSGGLNGCNGLKVSAVGNKGTRESFQLSQLLCTP
jgi:hypothetical protein